VRIGDRVIIKANAAIGNDGFSFQTVEPGSAELARQTGKAQPTDSEILRINSVGTIVIEDDVEIGACSCIDRATLHETRIGRGTKIDNLVQIAHNVQIGRKCVIVSMAGIAGSATIGDRVVIAAQAGIPDHKKIGDDCVIMPQAGVTRDLPPKSTSAAVPRAAERIHQRPDADQAHQDAGADDQRIRRASREARARPIATRWRGRESAPACARAGR
jgi:UDP-3-O-[3-hydroxymyristoyl] glucosamine N-acyltransferase